MGEEKYKFKASTCEYIPGIHIDIKYPDCIRIENDEEIEKIHSIIDPIIAEMDKKFWEEIDKFKKLERI